MKLRNGFVSNSSSSSFLVEIEDVFTRVEENKQKRWITEEQEEFLLDNHFDYT